MDVNVATTKQAYIDIFQYGIKKSNQFTCIGWINNPSYPDSDPIILLAISDISGDVLSVDSSIRFEIIKDGTDHRLQFSNSMSKKVALTTGVRLDDTLWHFIGYVCQGTGDMLYYVDGIQVPVEDGIGEDGILLSKAWSRSGRQGGGDVWCPYLYKAGQAVSIYNWRFGANFQIHQAWLQQLMAVDRPYLA